MIVAIITWNMNLENEKCISNKKNGMRKGVGTRVPLNRDLYKRPPYKGPLVWISKPVILHLKKEAMSLLVHVHVHVFFANVFTLSLPP